MHNLHLKAGIFRIFIFLIDFGAGKLRKCAIFSFFFAIFSNFVGPKSAKNENLENPLTQMKIIIKI